MGMQIRIDVRSDGTIEATTVGIKGTKCLDEVERIEALVGERAQSSRLTADFTDTQPEDALLRSEDHISEAGNGDTR
jgi:hypothetical protein